jgi:hypothetical protein
MLTVHYAPSHQSALLALYLSRSSELLVLTSNQAVKKLCIQFDVRVQLVDFGQITIKSIKSFIAVRRRIEVFISGYHPSTRLIISHNSYDLIGLGMAALWFKNKIGPVEYYPVDPKLVKYSIWKNVDIYKALSLYYMQLLSFIFLDIRGLSIYNSVSPFLGITTCFLNKVNAYTHSGSYVDKIKNETFKMFKIDSNKDILFIGDVSQFSSIESKKFQKFMEVISEYRDHVLVKPHPRDNSSPFNLLDYAEGHIPAEFYIEDAKIVIGFCSEAMRFSMKKDKNVISIVKIIFNDDHRYVTFCDNFLKKDVTSKYKVPESIADLKMLIEKIMEA